jgi:hypothetical protein
MPRRLTTTYLGMRFPGTHYARFDGENLVDPDAPSKAVDFIHSIRAGGDA